MQPSKHERQTQIPGVRHQRNGVIIIEMDAPGFTVQQIRTRQIVLHPPLPRHLIWPRMDAMIARNRAAITVVLCHMARPRLRPSDVRRMQASDFDRAAAALVETISANCPRNTRLETTT